MMKMLCGMSVEVISGLIFGRNVLYVFVVVSLGDEGLMIFMLSETKTVVVILGCIVFGLFVCLVVFLDVVVKVGSG